MPPHRPCRSCGRPFPLDEYRPAGGVGRSHADCRECRASQGAMTPPRPQDATPELMEAVARTQALEAERDALAATIAALRDQVDALVADLEAMRKEKMLREASARVKQRRAAAARQMRHHVDTLDNPRGRDDVLRDLLGGDFY